MNVEILEAYSAAIKEADLKIANIKHALINANLELERIKGGIVSAIAIDPHLKNDYVRKSKETRDLYADEVGIKLYEEEIPALKKQMAEEEAARDYAKRAYAINLAAYSQQTAA